MSDTPSRPCALAHDRAQITDLVAAMVAIDSVNPDLVAGAAGEQAMADFVASWLRLGGLDVELVEPVRGRPRVIATARGRGGGRSLMLSGHIDTVGVANMPDPHTPRVADGRLHGRGAFDMKGGLAACMVAAAAAVRLELAGDVAPPTAPAAISASVINGGRELSSSYPKRCTLQLERRTIPGESRQMVTEQLHALVDRVCQADPQAGLRLAARLVRDPFESSPDADIVRLLRQQADRVAGEPVQVVGDSVWLDAALSAAAGIPTVVFGPGSAGAHPVEEWVDLASVELCAQTLPQTAAAFCA
jgi:acetylornithine deacetylase/succinyl-diaminopimelate desuccinylase-like protein